MKIIKLIVLFLIIVSASVAVYFLFVVKTPQAVSLNRFLLNESVLFHSKQGAVTKDVVMFTDVSKDFFDFLSLHKYKTLADLYNYEEGIVSWHLTRQEKLVPFVWLFLPEGYDFETDSLAVGEPIGELYEIKSGESTFYFTRGDSYVVLGVNGEMMEKISSLKFSLEEAKNQIKLNQFLGNLNHLKTYATSFAPYLSYIPNLHTSYSANFFGKSSPLWFHAFADSVLLTGLTHGTGTDNVNIPLSTRAFWQCKFESAQSLVHHISFDKTQLLWDAEERYQFKISELADAWFEGTALWFYFDKDAQNGTVAAFKLRNDAAPFAAVDQFFSDFSTTEVTVDGTRSKYTIARFIPGELAALLIPDAGESKNLFVMQLDNYFYWSTNKTLLIMIANELLNNAVLNDVCDATNSQGVFYLNFIHAGKEITIQGRMLQHTGVYMQGTVTQKQSVVQKNP